MTITRGSLPVGEDAPITAALHSNVADDAVLLVAAGEAGVHSLGDGNASGDIVWYRIVNRSDAPVVARYKFKDSATSTAWAGAAALDTTGTGGTDYVPGGEGSVELPMRGAGARIHGLQIAGYATSAPDAARAAVDVSVLVRFRGAD